MDKNEINNNENSYKSILKGISLLGSVQVFQILVNLVRGKLIAMFLGPEGMGIASLFTSSSNTITRFSTLGLNLAFVKEVAAHKNDPFNLATVIHVAGHLIRLTSLLGALVCLIMSPWLSIWSFGTDGYTWQFVLLSVAIFFTVAGTGEGSVLQGLHKVKLLSYTSLGGALSGLLFGVPLYYFYGNAGIVPAMIILSLTSWGCYTYGVRKVRGSIKIRFNRKEHLPLAKRMLGLGITLLVSTLINTLCTYLINIFVRSTGNLTDVGLFNAANSITLQYSGIVFSAMALDYFPRLSAAVENQDEMKSIINRQMEIVALIATPLSILLIVLSPVIIQLLLTSEFLGVTGLMRWLGAAILLKAIAYPLGYLAFAKNNRKLFFWTEGIICNALYLGMSVIFYKYFGLMGLGYGAVAEQFLCILLYLAVNLKAYGFSPNRDAWKETILAILLGGAAFLSTVYMNDLAGYIAAGSVFLISLSISCISLKHKIKTR